MTEQTSTENPYAVHEEFGSFYVYRHYSDGEQLLIVECESRAEADEVAAAEWEREQEGGMIP